ncbi:MULTISPECIES: helix-turn-helix transcriptional regulator [unclassified Streptomyces]|uniref:helix-turn-helix transcriptional regulator n=1 Tax=unclassified Streptomyces TaxID=2593676 RepID=UPI002DD982C6|nr:MULTISPECIES: helix-turn-helix transcriptional regulator [unclassified Streptomyces]WSA96461.1 helix-turn-helix transcriptional regulator [Streptomyces sp. NBC_01795]WSB80873.1 helix-turn-helix transcriptional regulator [Streptomyces sp. NBC_01775]WSS10915.1 helix-turn-helix transcriptional regulator [Streptomyces sp. NBC_01186]WSS39612.1 helix-turn-helix transcriptional regulator [Streptomyces sp. NBC_01187]
MSSNAHRNELGEFLKARRADLSPWAVGLPDTGGARRVAGLRREEVAQLAAISTDYYTRLEQGRVPASGPVLTVLARVLHLSDDQREYLFSLAGKPSNRSPRRTHQKVQPQLQRLLDDLTATPGIVLGRRMDILSWNALAAAMITDFGEIPEKKRNYIRLVFTEPAMRTLYVDWKTVARTCVAQLRMEAAKCPDDPRLTSLVGELSVQDSDFRKWWAAHDVATLSVGTKSLYHPVAGELTLDWDTLTASTDPDQQLVIWTAAPDTPSYEGLRFLASWAGSDQDTTTDRTH